MVGLAVKQVVALVLFVACRESRMEILFCLWLVNVLHVAAIGRMDKVMVCSHRLYGNRCTVPVGMLANDTVVH